MRVVIASLVAPLVAVACSYNDPAVDGRFKCDDAHPCAGHEACLAGTCSGADASPSGSADGVKCGTTSCGADMQCCTGPVSTPVCQPIGATCNAGIVTSCDGVEDCGADQACCGTSAGACGAASCAVRICQSSADCLAVGATNCSFELAYASWGFCR